MKIVINQIPPEGLILKESVWPGEFDLETDIVRFAGPINIKAEISKITNAVSVSLALSGSMHMHCSRCLNEFAADFKKNLQLNYPVNKSDLVLDLNTDIRQEIILDYPLKPLCIPDCKGLCPKCGRNLNEGNCDCN